MHKLYGEVVQSRGQLPLFLPSKLADTMTVLSSDVTCTSSIDEKVSTRFSRNWYLELTQKGEISKVYLYTRYQSQKGVFYIRDIRSKFQPRKVILVKMGAI